MKRRWYLSHKGKKHGPYSKQKLHALAAQGRLQPDDLIWEEGASEQDALPASAALQSLPGISPSAVPDWLADVELLQSRGPVPPPTAGAEDPLWLEDMRLWFGLELVEAETILTTAAPAHAPGLQPEPRSAPTQRLPDWLEDWLPGNRPTLLPDSGSKTELLPPRKSDPVSETPKLPEGTRWPRTSFAVDYAPSSQMSEAPVSVQGDVGRVEVRDAVQFASATPPEAGPTEKPKESVVPQEPTQPSQEITPVPPSSAIPAEVEVPPPSSSVHEPLPATPIATSVGDVLPTPIASPAEPAASVAVASQAAPPPEGPGKVCQGPSTPLASVAEKKPPDEACGNRLPEPVRKPTQLLPSSSPRPTEVKFAEPASPSRSTTQLRAPTGPPLASTRPVESAKASPPASAPTSVAEERVVRKTILATGFDPRTGQILDPQKFNKWKNQKCSASATSPSMTNESMFEVFRKARTAIEHWVDDDRNHALVIAADIQEISNHPDIQTVFRQYESYGKEMHGKLDRHLRFMVENRRKYRMAMGG